MENRPVPLVADRAVAGGRMLARVDGRVVLVSGAIPGERVLVQIERATRQVAWADVVEVLDPSPDRRDAPSDAACGGAFYSHIRYERQLQLKAEVIADAFRRIGKISLDQPVPVRPSPERGYRLRARLHVQNGRFGFFREGTHTLCDAGLTGQLSVDAIEGVAAAIGVLGARATHVAEILIAENVAATERVLHLVPIDGAHLDDLPSPESMVTGVTGLTTVRRGRGVLLNGTALVTDTAAQLFGPDPPIDGGVAWSRHPTPFFQGNRFLIGALVRRVLELSHGERVVDLYSGVGLFAVALAAHGRKVVAVEGDEASAHDLIANAEPWSDRLRVVTSGVEAVTARALTDGADVVVVDPPRTGLSAEAVRGLLEWQAPRLVYVSCDPPTLARDAAKILAAGYSLRSIEAFDLFPNTPHVETLVAFDR